MSTPTRIDRGHYLTEQEERQLRSRVQERADADRARGRHQGVRQQAVVAIALYTGARVCELAALTVGDLDLTRKGLRTIKVRTAKQRSKDAHRILPLNDTFTAYIESWIKWMRDAGWAMSEGMPLVPSTMGGPLSIRGWQDAWNSACARAGLQGLDGKSRFSIHDARHTRGMRLYHHRKDGVKDLLTVQRWLGHASPTITAKYYATVALDDMLKAVE